MRRTWSGASPGSRGDVKRRSTGNGGGRRPDPARPSRRLPGNARPEGEGAGLLVTSLSSWPIGCSPLPLKGAGGSFSSPGGQKKKKPEATPPRPPPGCPLSPPAGPGVERRESQAAPLGEPGLRAALAVCSTSLAPAPAPPPPRPELGNSPAASLRARRALHVVGRGGAPSPTLGQLSPSIPGTESSKAFLILSTVPILLMRRLSYLHSKGCA